MNDCKLADRKRNTMYLLQQVSCELWRMVKWRWRWRRLPIHNDNWYVIRNTFQTISSMCKCMCVSGLYTHTMRDVNSWIIKNSFIRIESIKPSIDRSFYELQSSFTYFTLFSFVLWLFEAFCDKNSVHKTHNQMTAKRNPKHLFMWMVHYFNLFAGPTKSTNW